jgi:hypothetical protein
MREMATVCSMEPPGMKKAGASSPRALAVLESQPIVGRFYRASMNVTDVSRKQTARHARVAPHARSYICSRRSAPFRSRRS